MGERKTLLMEPVRDSDINREVPGGGMTILQRTSKQSKQHVHVYEAIPAGAGLTRRICRACHSVSIGTPQTPESESHDQARSNLFSASASSKTLIGQTVHRAAYKFGRDLPTE